jgi:tetratricopeptide (TPR) repeat protein
MKKILGIILTSVLFTSCSLSKDNSKQEKEYTEKAKEFESKNMLDSAIFFYKKALEINKNSLYYANIGGLYNIQNNAKGAKVFLDSAIQISPNDAFIYNNRAKSYALMQEFDMAINDLKQALKLDPTLYIAKQGLSDLYFNQGKYDSALVYLNEVVSKEPQNSVFRYYRGKSNMNVGQYDKALEDLNFLLKTDSLNGDYLFVRAFTYAGLKKPDAAIADFNKLIALDPNEETTVYRNLAEIYLMAKKDKKKACEYIHLDAKLYKKEVSKEDLQKYCGK